MGYLFPAESRLLFRRMNTIASILKPSGQKPGISWIAPRARKNLSKQKKVSWRRVRARPFLGSDNSFCAQEPLQDARQGMALPGNGGLAFCYSPEKTISRDQSAFWINEARMGFSFHRNHHWQNKLEDVHIPG